MRGAWLRPGTHLDLVGSFAPGMRETDDDAVQRAVLYVDTDEALTGSGDLCHLAVTPRGTLATLCDGSSPGRQNAEEVTLFKSVGSSLEDLVAAELVAAGSV